MGDKELKHLTTGQNALLPNYSKDLLVLAYIDLTQFTCVTAS